MINRLFICFVLFSFLGKAQTKSDVLTEASRRNITSKTQVDQILIANGISETEARQMARLRGMNYDELISSLGGSKEQIITPTTDALSVVNDTIVNEVSPVVEQQNNILPSDPSYFGYDIFTSNPFREKEYLLGNIDEGYIVAPGDVLRVSIFGDNSADFEVKVDLNGNIRLPEIGVFMASGYTFSSLRERLSQYLGKSFSGLLSEPKSTFIDVSLTQIRPTKVIVLGEVNAPGPHLVNGLASTLNALYSAGGIKTSGSLRQVFVYRNNKKLKEIDLYEYITKGSLTDDIRLMNNDIVFVPTKDFQVKFSGETRFNGFFELKKGEGISQLIKFSGGLPPTASLTNVNITRIDQKTNKIEFPYVKELITIDLNKSIDQSGPGILFPGDEVVISKIVDKTTKAITIEGHVQKPGTYSLDAYSSLYELLMVAGQGPLPDVYLNKLDVFREDLNGKKTFNTYSLTSVLDKTVDVPLKDQDVVRVYANAEVVGEPKVFVSGFVSESKEFFWRESLSIYDVIFQSTSFDELEYQSKILKERVDLQKFDVVTGKYYTNTYSLNDLSELKTTFLDPKDIVIVYSKAITNNLNQQIEVSGYANAPGFYPLEDQMYLEDAILRAQGFQNYAVQTEVLLYRENFDIKEERYYDIINYQVDLDYLMGLKSTPNNPIFLKHNDRIVIRRPNGSGKDLSIQVNGEVVYPGAIFLENKKVRFDEILNLAGGLKSNASLESSYVIREGLLLSFDLSKKKNHKRVFLKDGDQIFIYDKSNGVETQGAVNNPMKFIYEPSARAKYYIRKSGGKIKKESDVAYVVNTNGTSSKVGWLSNPKVRPGSKIFVERKVIVEKDKSNFGDEFIRVFGIVSSSLTTILLVTKL